MTFTVLTVWPWTSVILTEVPRIAVAWETSFSPSNSVVSTIVWIIYMVPTGGTCSSMEFLNFDGKVDVIIFHIQKAGLLGQARFYSGSIGSAHTSFLVQSSYSPQGFFTALFHLHYQTVINSDSAEIYGIQIRFSLSTTIPWPLELPLSP